MSDFMSSDTTEYSLFPTQYHIFRNIMYRLIKGKPTIVWAGLSSGKTLIGRKVSWQCQNARQVMISNKHDDVDGYYMTHDDHIMPEDLPLDNSEETIESAWEQITPMTIVFIENLFELPNAEELLERIIKVTPHVVAFGKIDAYAANANWAVGKYVNSILGPYATWEMNPLYDPMLLRNERPKGIANHRSFNNDCAAVVNSDNWKFWSKKKK